MIKKNLGVLLITLIMLFPNSSFAMEVFENVNSQELFNLEAQNRPSNYKQHVVLDETIYDVYNIYKNASLTVPQVLLDSVYLNIFVENVGNTRIDCVIRNGYNVLSEETIQPKSNKVFRVNYRDLISGANTSFNNYNFSIKLNCDNPGNSKISAHVRAAYYVRYK
ncbi:MAG: hypothetical protein SOR77_03040 [Peptoniphilus sp.]|uniref:hypothetical protein n=1 Tax=Peptoniphilus sp. TaxID=1971214 RepID=UPI002A75271D|nr:hypothetical protein [Peptoniphilus sp.]MDY2986591.1 hypothetical protein [Peptoniphilus sp.]